MKTFLLLMAMTVAAAADPAFTIVVNTGLPGTSANNQFTLPLRLGVAYNFTVDWGDSVTEVITSSTSPTHTYAGPPGTRTVKITENVAGGFSQIFFGRSGDCLKLTQIANWGDVHWRNFQQAFTGCSNLVITAADAASARTGTVFNFRSAWDGCSGMTSFPLLNTAAATSFESAWSGCSGFDQLPNPQWYQVVAVPSGKTIRMREIASLVSETASMQGTCLPSPGVFTGEPLLKRVVQDNYIRMRHGCLSLWDERPQSWSSYG